MTQVSQDFTIYAGDNSGINIDITDAGSIINLGGITDIVWTLQRDLNSVVVLTKSYNDGEMTFPDGPATGRVQIDILPADTVSLYGYYIHRAVLTDGQGLVTTIMLGRVQIGRAPIWTYSGDPNTSSKDAVRFLIGDTIQGDPLLQDGEINYAITLRKSVYGAAAQCCRSLAAFFSRQADSTQGELRTAYSSRARNYAYRAAEYENRNTLEGSSGFVFAGGISQADKTSRELNTDRVKPQFNLGMTDNSIPVAPGANESLSQDAGEA